MDSKELSYILRHNPGKYGLKPDEYGYVKVNELLAVCKITFEELNEIVDSNTRFFYNSDYSKIRAAHGHSYPVKPVTQQLPPPIPLYHGTAKDTYEKFIKKQGIKKMNRTYVHLSEKEDDARRIGSRHGKPVVIVLDTKQMFADGYKFFKSEDNVWLTSDISPKYIKEVR